MSIVLSNISSDIFPKPQSLISDELGLLKTHSQKKKKKNYKYITARTQAGQNGNFTKITNKKSNYHSKKKLELNHPNISHKASQIQRDLVTNLEKIGALKRWVSFYFIDTCPCL